MHELVITEDGDLEFRCNAKPTDEVSPECWFTAEGEDLGVCHAFKRMDSIELYDEIVIPVGVSWMGPDNSPVLTSCWDDELEEPHSREDRISREPPYSSSLYCSCNQGPFSTDYAWAQHQASASCEGVQPFSFASASTTSSTSKAASLKTRPLCTRLAPPDWRAMRDPSGAAWPRRYLPVKNPPARGDQGINAKP